MYDDIDSEKKYIYRVILNKAFILFFIRTIQVKPLH